LHGKGERRMKRNEYNGRRYSLSPTFKAPIQMRKQENDALDEYESILYKNKFKNNRLRSMGETKQQPEIITCTGGSFYISMDAPWQSEEDNAAYELAVRKFEELKRAHSYVALIQSHHWATHGYWIETKEKKVEFPDHTIRIWKQNSPS